MNSGFVKFKDGGVKVIEGVDIALEYGYESYMSVDSRAGKIKSKYTRVRVNDDIHLNISGWVDHQRAFNDARDCYKATKWEF